MDGSLRQQGVDARVGLVNHGDMMAPGGGPVPAGAFRVGKHRPQPYTPPQNPPNTPAQPPVEKSRCQKPASVGSGLTGSAGRSVASTPSRMHAHAPLLTSALKGRAEEGEYSPPNREPTPRSARRHHQPTAHGTKPHGRSPTGAPKRGRRHDPTGPAAFRGGKHRPQPQPPPQTRPATPAQPPVDRCRHQRPASVGGGLTGSAGRSVASAPDRLHAHASPPPQRRERPRRGGRVFAAQP